MTTLLCTVRDCRLPLAREERSLVCARGHSFDVAKSGYCNLLQPQDRRSLNPGDSRKAVAARRRFLDRGFAEPLVRDIVTFVEQSGAARERPILDVGCGEGHHLDALQRALRAEGHGVDISVPAIDSAARRYREAFFVIANADRFLPYAGGSFALITSITSRMNPKEFDRVMSPDGRLLVALPGPDDLIQLREAILGEAKLIDRVERTTGVFSEQFTLARHERAAHDIHLDREAIHDVMASSYRGLRTSQREKLEAIEGMNVTLSRDLLEFRRRSS